MNAKSKLLVLISTLLISASWASASYACKAPKADGLTIDQLNTLYECLRPKLVKGYQKKGNKIAAAYTDWKAASSTPQAPGMHSGQYLMTYVNDIGFDQYTKYLGDSTAMPVGTVIAKEAFSLNKKGKAKNGPLLFMEKVGLDAAPDTGGWKYTGIKPNGKRLKVDAKGFCHACHQAWPHQDFQGYPVEGVRISSN